LPGPDIGEPQVSRIVTTALFALLYRVLPDVRLRWRDVTTGAFVTAVLFTIGQQFIGLYLGQSSVASTYGATGSVMILLLWVYYSCQILLFGAEFARTRCAKVLSPTLNHSLKRTSSRSARRPEDSFADDHRSKPRAVKR
jgi:uncharacterized BrkB/YihY/UPF0761 family membrane protein